MDGTFLGTSLKNQKKIKHYFLIAIDPATNKIIGYLLSKLIYSNINQKTCNAYMVLKTLELTFYNQGIGDTLLINTNQGSQLMSYGCAKHNNCCA